jgi:TolA-binding protein
MSPRKFVRAFTFSTALILPVAAGWAQTTGGAPPKPPTTGGTTSTGGIGTTPSNIPSTNNTNGTSKNQAPNYSPPFYVTGRVLLEDGSPPPEPVTIERLCNGQSHAEGYTDSHGNFGIEVGNEQGVFQDASEDSTRNSFPGLSSGAGPSSNTMNSPLGSSSGLTGSYSKYQNCELRAKLAGYRSQLISLANRRPLDDPNIGTILLHKDNMGETGTTVSASSLGAPKDARKAYEHGMQAVKKNKLEDASKEFEKAVELYPGYAEAWFELGRIQVGRGQQETARQSFNSAIKGDPKFVGPYVQLALLSMQTKNWPELADVTDRGMRLDSFDYPQLFLFNSVANYNLHKFELAERSIKQAIRLDTQHRFPEIPHLNGLLMLLHKDYDNAAEQFRSYLKMAPNADDAGSVREQLRRIERLTAQSAVSEPKDK